MRTFIAALFVVAPSWKDNPSLPTKSLISLRAGEQTVDHPRSGARVSKEKEPALITHDSVEEPHGWDIGDSIRMLLLSCLVTDQSPLTPMMCLLCPHPHRLTWFLSGGWHWCPQHLQGAQYV